MQKQVEFGASSGKNQQMSSSFGQCQEEKEEDVFTQRPDWKKRLTVQVSAKAAAK